MRYETAKRVAIIDWAKAVCIIFVIMNHSGRFDRYNDIFFLLAIDTAVPVFMILSGYTFAMKNWDVDRKKMYERK